MRSECLMCPPGPVDPASREKRGGGDGWRIARPYAMAAVAGSADRAAGWRCPRCLPRT
ncbi:Uncharacterised protein [Bordetella pertussis]|nr:Uncharacterised protein [Bordetella pertussis]